MATKIILSCEHAGNRVPAGFQHLFADADQVLASHRGWDPGALALAKTFQRRLAAPLFYSSITRLLVESNRSLGHRQLFSDFTSPLADQTKQQILAKFYRPYREKIESWIAAQIEQALDVLHVSLHTFTPELDGKVRRADIGLLYDPHRDGEKRLCDRWRTTILGSIPDLRVRRNYPYLGSADGLTTFLRRRFGRPYTGIELEVNQRWIGSPATWTRMQGELAESFSLAHESYLRGA